LSKTLIVTLTIALMTVACSSSPTDAYNRMVAAAQLDDRESFVESFTENSRHLVAASLALSDDYGPKKSAPYRMLVHTEVLDEESGEAEAVPGKSGEERDVAYIVVQVAQGKRRIKMVKEDGDWRIDALDLEAFWADRKNFRF